MQTILQLDGGAEGTWASGDFFRRRREHVTIAEVASFLRIENIESLYGDGKITDLKTLSSAGRDEVTFFLNPKYVNDLKTTRAEYCLIDGKNVHMVPDLVEPIIVQNVHYAYARILDCLYLVPQFLVRPSISTRAWVDPTAEIGSGVEIQPNVYVGERVKIGNNCKICTNVTINHNCQIGDRTYIGPNSVLSYARVGSDVVIQNGVNIGQCGFGFAHEKGFNYKIPQIGLVLIGDDVEIGSGTTIDRGALDDTVIGNNTKIDNLVQIAHGVKIGMGCFLAAQVGIAGSTKIGNHVQMGGKVGVVGHLTIGDGAKIAAGSGVAKNVAEGTSVGGCPAMPINDWIKSTVVLKNLARR
jgi:UDP-3-O-[3-hydroxymyristoyl] glucosamine N-acyltransferase